MASHNSSSGPPFQARPVDTQNSRDPNTSIVALSKIKSRRERPCDACRQRKTRCVTNEGDTVCTFCKSHGRDCTFVQKPAPRKRKLADEVGRSSTEVSEAVRWKSSSGFGQTDRVKQEDPSASRDQSGLSDQEETNSEGSQIPFDPSDMSLLGQTTLDFDVLSLLDFDQRQTASSNLGSIRRNEGAYMLVSNDRDVDVASSDARDVKEIETIVGDYGPYLLDAYFHYVHPSLPIINEPHLRKVLQENPASCSPALLAGIYVLGLGFWDRNEELADLQRPDLNKLENVASRSIDNFNGPRNLSAIQAGLLLSHSVRFESWARTAQLIAVAQDVGLHLDCSSWTIPHWERRLRKRVAWALYVQDKWAALIHGRPSHIYGNDWAVPPLVLEDFEDNVDAPDGYDQAGDHPAAGFTAFEQLIALTSITSDILETFYTPRAFQELRDAHSGGTRLILTQAKPLQMRLKEWFAALPASLRMDNVGENQEGVIVPSIGSLHLAYYASEMTLHRRIISSLSSSLSNTPMSTSRPPSNPSSPPGTNSMGSPLRSEKSPADNYLGHIVRTAAKTRLISALDFVNRLRPAHLFAFWHFFSAAAFALIGSFGSLLQATAPAQEEAEFYKARLREYRWTLEVSSKWAQACGGMQEALERLDALTEVLERAPSKPWLQRDADSVGNSTHGEHARDGDAMNTDHANFGIQSATNPPGMINIPRPEFYGDYAASMPTPPSQEGSSPIESSGEHSNSGSGDEVLLD